MIHTLYVTGMHLFATVYSFVGQFSLRAHNSSHLYFSAPISCSMPIVKNFWDIPYYTMLYLLSRYHCLDYPTYCAFVIQINYLEVFPIAMIHLNFYIFIEYLRRYNRCMSWNALCLKWTSTLNLMLHKKWYNIKSDWLIDWFIYLVLKHSFDSRLSQGLNMVMKIKI